MKKFTEGQKDIQEKVNLLESENANLKHRLLKLKTYSRRYNVRLMGIKEDKNEDCKVVIQRIMTEVGLGLSDYEIVIAHRISSKVRPRPIIAQLVG